MRSINFVIVEADEAYNNEKEICRGINIITNTTIESVEHINRIARVIQAPDFTILEPGDEVVVHHNIFRKRNNLNGKQIESNYFMEDNRYFVPLSEVFMYRRDTKHWEAIEPYCFVKPIPKKIKEKIGSIYLPESQKENTHKGMLRHIGVMVYPNKDLKDNGVVEGDRITFSKDSEYEFNIDGEVYYRMRTRDITGKVLNERT